MSGRHRVALFLRVLAAEFLDAESQSPGQPDNRLLPGRPPIEDFRNMGRG